jgi:hypothetical protein
MEALMNTAPRDLVVMITRRKRLAPTLRARRRHAPLFETERGQMIKHRDIAWWYWAATAAALVVGLAGWPEAFYLATALGVAQILHFWVREGRLTAFPVQVRLVFTAVLLLCAW